MRVLIVVTLTVFGYGAIALIAQQNVSNKVIVGTMLKVKTAAGGESPDESK